MVQSDNTVTVAESDVDVKSDFGADDFVETARTYRGAKRLIDAVSGYDSLDDAIAILKEAHAALECQSEMGGGYTPPVEMKFGSDSAAVIADKLLGRSKTVGATRTAFAGLGK